MIPKLLDEEPSLQHDSNHADCTDKVAEHWLQSLVDDTNKDHTKTNDNDKAHGSWFIRNTSARDDTTKISKDILPEPRIGLGIVHALAGSKHQNKNNETAIDVTGQRRERKSVLPMQSWTRVEGLLAEQGIHLENREKQEGGSVATSRTRSTLTYYGTSLVFYNHQVKTKIRMRIRYYLSYIKNEDGTIAAVQREGATKDKGFLELKVKSPRASDPGSVDKYRLSVSDDLVAQLVNLDPTAPDFLSQLDIVKQGVQKESKEEQSALIDTMFHVIGKLAKRKASFIRPSLVVTYERSAFTFNEPNYPVPALKKTTKNKRQSSRQMDRLLKKSRHGPRLANVFQWRRGRSASKGQVQSSETSSSGNDSETQDLTLHPEGAPVMNATQNVQFHDIEYQFTIDRNVRALYPLLPKKGASQMPVAEHFDLANKTELMRYPSEARVVEFKEPLVVATLPEKDRSPIHNFLVHILVDRMQSEIMFGDYDENVGKYGNFRRRLMEEHHTNRIKNHQIRIDFSGTGEYENEA